MMVGWEFVPSAIEMQPILTDSVTVMITAVASGDIYLEPTRWSVKQEEW